MTKKAVFVEKKRKQNVTNSTLKNFFSSPKKVISFKKWPPDLRSISYLDSMLNFSNVTQEKALLSIE